MKTKLLFLILLIVFAVTLSGCSMCGRSGGDNSNVNINANANVNVNMATPPLSPTPTPTPPPDVVTGVPECDELFAKFEAWAARKNKDGSKAEKMAVLGIKMALIIPIKKKIEKMKPSDRDQLAVQCQTASLQFEEKQRALEVNANTAP